MAQALPHTQFNTSRLVRVLADLAPGEVHASKQPFADKLGQWLGFNDALTLFSALNAGAADVVEDASAAPQCAAANKAFARVRAALVASSSADGVLKLARETIASADPEASSDFAPYHRYYLARQRDMNVSIGPLRATVRAALTGHSAALRQLAALDAVMDQTLAARERDLLATVPVLLGKRFSHLFTAHQARVAQAQGQDEVGQWLAPGAWLAQFCREMHTVLRAELDLRLQPIAGLLAACDNEVTRKQ